MRSVGGGLVRGFCDKGSETSGPMRIENVPYQLLKLVLARLFTCCIKLFVCKLNVNFRYQKKKPIIYPKLIPVLSHTLFP